MARGMEKLTFKMCFISARLNLNSNMWLIATVLDSAVPKRVAQSFSKLMFTQVTGGLCLNADSSSVGPG